jgi:hypothetical protein
VGIEAMSFDWTEFLFHHNIAFTDQGRNVSGPHIVIHCPFCGADDPSEHMSINLYNAAWRCWRNPDKHAGYSPIRLICALIKCTPAQAREMLGYPVRELTDIDAQVLKILNPPVNIIPDPPAITLPDNFRPLNDGKPSSKRFIKYLKRRGFGAKSLKWIIPKFDLRYCVSGSFKERIIFPVTLRGRVVNAVGRAIHPDAHLRYRSLTVDPNRSVEQGLPAASLPTSKTLLFYDHCTRTAADALVVCEGPFDALQLTRLGHLRGLVATCLYTSLPSQTQIDLLHQLLPRFNHRIILLDRTATAQAMRVQQRLASLQVRMAILPEGIDDPGELRDLSFLASQ